MIDVSTAGHRRTITLNRPDKANALTVEMLSMLVDAVNQIAGDANVRSVVLTGAGDRVFSAGADLGEPGITQSPLWETLSQRLSMLPCLTIAALNGTLAGGAFGMVLACDLRIAVPEAKFFYPVLKNGFLPQPSDVGRLVELIGMARAKLILLGGQKLTAEQALATGLVDQMAPREVLVDMIDAWASDADATGDPGLTAIKRMFDRPLAPDTLKDAYRTVYDGDLAALVRLRDR